MSSVSSVVNLFSQSAVVAAVKRDLAALAEWKTPAIRRVRRTYAKALSQAPAAMVTRLVVKLAASGDWARRVVAFELLASHQPAFNALDAATIDRLSSGLSDWGSVDLFGVTISGPAWREGLLSDRTISRWVKSPDRWRRRLALVSTVPLNARSRGGGGDTVRTLRVCRALIGDRDPMVVKAMSWALRELAKRDPATVRQFVATHDQDLPALVRREVRNKLTTGRKSPPLGR